MEGLNPKVSPAQIADVEEGLKDLIAAVENLGAHSYLTAIGDFLLAAKKAWDLYKET
jgi:hypothetical protein